MRRLWSYLGLVELGNCPAEPAPAFFVASNLELVNVLTEGITEAMLLAQIPVVAEWLMDVSPVGGVIASNEVSQPMSQVRPGVLWASQACPVVCHPGGG